MPDEQNDVSKTEQPDPAIQKIKDGVVAGLQAGMPEILKQISQAQPRETPKTTQAAPTIQIPDDVSDEEFDRAVKEGAPLAPLLRRRDAHRDAKFQRELANLRTAGGAAIGSAVRQSAQGLKYYSRFKDEIDAAVDGFVANTGAVPTFEHYQQAHDLIKARHFDELVNEETEERIRKAREPEDLPAEGGRGRTREPQEAQSLTEWFQENGIDSQEWNRTLRRKARTGQGGSEEMELRKIGYTGGYKQFTERKKRLDVIEEETDSSFYLDRDWNPRLNNGQGGWVAERSGRSSLEIDI